MELVKFLREAEQYKYTADEVQAALIHCKDMNPVDWLRQNWEATITSVQTLATQMGREGPMNIVGTVSEIEARDALRLHKGNIWDAVTECVETRQRKVHKFLCLIIIEFLQNYFYCSETDSLYFFLV